MTAAWFDPLHEHEPGTGILTGIDPSKDESGIIIRWTPTEDGLGMVEVALHNLDPMLAIDLLFGAITTVGPEFLSMEDDT